MQNRSIIIFLALLGVFSASSLRAEGHGKIDVGVAGIELKIRNFGDTIKTLDMVGVSANGHIGILQCPKDTALCLKPRVIYADGHKGDLFCGGLGLGYYIPVLGCFSIVPTGGINFDTIHTDINYSVPLPNGTVLSFTEQSYKSRTWTPFIGLDLGYIINDNWSVCLMYQFGWSNSCTQVHGLPNTRIQTTGSNVAAQVDYYFTCNWSVNVAAAYNTSENNELHGARGGGIRVGLGYIY